MHSLNRKHQASFFPMITAPSSDTSIVRKTGSSRLIVLVPPDSEYGPPTRQIWELAVDTGRHVQLLSLCKDMVDEPCVRRQLILMSALVGDSRITTETKVEMGVNWIDVVKRNYQAGDLIVCFADQREELFQKPVSQILEANLDAPVYILPDLYLQRQSRHSVLSSILLWAGLIGIIAGAFLLQIQIMSLSQAWTQITVLILSVLAEFWLLLTWNNLLS